MKTETQDALTEMAFQFGCVGLLKFDDMLDALEAGNCEDAKREALDSVWGRSETPARAKRVTGPFVLTFN